MMKANESKITKITIDGYHCLRCDHVWVKHKVTVGDPEICPKCKSARWYLPKTR